MNEREKKILSEKIYKGLEIARKRLVEQKKRDDQNLVIFRDGKVVVAKARELYPD